jgi:hypothetical protein
VEVCLPAGLSTSVSARPAAHTRLFPAVFYSPLVKTRHSVNSTRILGEPSGRSSLNERGQTTVLTFPTSSVKDPGGCVSDTPVSAAGYPNGDRPSAAYLCHTSVCRSRPFRRTNSRRHERETVIKPKTRGHYWHREKRLLSLEF